MDFPIAVSSPLVVCILRTTSSMFSKLLGRRTDDEIGPFCDDVELVVGDDRGDLDDDVVRRGPVRSSPGPSRRAPMGIVPGSGSAQLRCAVVLEIPLVRLDETLPLPSYARLGGRGLRPGCQARCDSLPGRSSRNHRDRNRGSRSQMVMRVWCCHGSGLAAQHGVTCLNAPGLIDPGYRGKVAVILVNTDPNSPYEVHRGDRIAQLVICRVEKALFVAVESLETSERGKGGFGHSGR